MPDSKITALTNLTAADAINDMFPIVDVSDNLITASGTTKRISVNNLLSSSPTASGAFTVTGLVTAGSATVTGAATVGTTLGVTGVSTLTGNVGIGVTPSAWGSGLKALQVGATGYGAFFDFNNDVIAMSANLFWTGSAYSRISASSKYALAYYQDIGGSHQWLTSSAAGTNAVAPTMNALMTLNASGNLLIGTTSNTSFSSRIALSYDSGVTNWAVGPSVSTPTGFFISANVGAQGVYLANATATSWTAWSDERLKDIIEPINNAVFKVGSLRAVIGKFKNDTTNTRKPFLIAQDVLAVLPEAVDVSNPDSFGVSYTDVIPLLVAAIKELTTRVQTLEAR